MLVDVSRGSVGVSSAGLPFEPPEKQAFLGAPDLAGRFDVLTTLLEIDASDPDDERPQLQ